MIIDTHAHIYKTYYEADLEEVIERAQKSGVEKIFLPNVDIESIPQVIAVAEQYPGICYPMVGLHPCDVKEDYKNQLGILKTWLEKHKFYAIGEIGMDLHWDLSFKQQQEDAFLQQLEWAVAYRLPIAIHSRKANDEVLALIRTFNNKSIKGVFHCFSGTLEQAEEMISLGFYLGIGGVVTYKNGGLDKIIEQIDIKHLVLETDAPYLPPVPHRGKKNEPSYLPYIVQKISEIKKMSTNEIEDITSKNALTLFGI